MRSGMFLAAALGLAVGCGAPPVEAPAEIDELSKYLFENFDSEDPAVMLAGAENLEAYMLLLDLASEDSSARAITLSELTTERLGSAPPPDYSVLADGEEAQNQVPVALSGRSIHDYDANRSLVAETNHVCIESNTTKQFVRTYTSDLGCFEDGSCSSVSTFNEVRKESLLAKVWYDVHKTYTELELADGRRVMFGRAHLDEIAYADGGSNRWEQLYSIEMWLEETEGTTLHYYAFWSAVHLPALGDGLYAAQVESGLDEGNLNADNFLSGNADCGNDRDFEYDREE